MIVSEKLYINKRNHRAWVAKAIDEHQKRMEDAKYIRNREEGLEYVKKEILNYHKETGKIEAWWLLWSGGNQDI